MFIDDLQRFFNLGSSLTPPKLKFKPEIINDNFMLQYKEFKEFFIENSTPYDPNEKSTQNDYYTYLNIDAELTGFYIGKGRGERITTHHSKARSSRWNEFFKSREHYTICITKMQSEQDAFATEAYLIRTFKRLFPELEMVNTDFGGKGRTDPIKRLELVDSFVEFFTMNKTMPRNHPQYFNLNMYCKKSGDYFDLRYKKLIETKRYLEMFTLIKQEIEEDLS